MARKNDKVEDIAMDTVRDEVIEENVQALVMAANNKDSLMEIFGTTQTKTALYTSLDRDTKEGRILIGKALGQADLKAAQFMDKPFPVADVLIHIIYLPIEDANGELTGQVDAQPRTVLIGPNGETAQFVSQGIARSLQNIMGLWGMPPWNPPLTVKLRQIETKRGRTYNLQVTD